MAAILSRWLNEARRIPPSELIRHIFDDTDIYVVYAALPDGVQRISNLEKFCDYVSGNERLGFYTIDRLVRDLTLLVDTEEREGEADAASDDDVVTVMTVHAAKGLEFPIVWVPRVSESMRTRSDAIEVDYRLGIGIEAAINRKSRDAGAVPTVCPDGLLQSTEGLRRGTSVSFTWRQLGQRIISSCLEPRSTRTRFQRIRQSIPAG